MRNDARLTATAAAVILLAVALGGCITVFPAKTAVTTDPRAGSLTYLPVVAFEQQVDPDTTECTSGTQSGTVFVPQLSKSVVLDMRFHITSVGEPFASQDFRHIDFTVADGDGTTWADIHVKNNDTFKKLTIDGPKPGGWTVTLVWNICNGNLGFVKTDDNLHAIVIVNQPV